MASKTASSAEPLAVVSGLIDIGTMDTVYRDVYLQRARTLLAAVLPSDEFRRLQQEEAELATLPVVIARALQRGEWAQVKQLSSRTEVLQRTIEARKRHVEVARGVYLASDVKLDPFSPGLHPFTRLGAREQTGMRIRALERLATLHEADAAWGEFYAARRKAFERLAVSATEAATTSGSALAMTVLTAGRKVPSPLPSRAVTPRPSLAVATSRLPSLSKSPMVSDWTLLPAGNSRGAPKLPSPLPSSTLTEPESLSVTRSGRPSWLKSAVSSSWGGKPTG